MDRMCPEGTKDAPLFSKPRTFAEAALGVPLLALWFVLVLLSPLFPGDKNAGYRSKNR